MFCCGSSPNLTWWPHQKETFSALLAICAGNSPVTGDFPAQRPVTRSFDVFFDIRLNKRFIKQSWAWWFETLSRHYDVILMIYPQCGGWLYPLMPCWILMNIDYCDYNAVSLYHDLPQDLHRARDFGVFLISYSVKSCFNHYTTPRPYCIPFTVASLDYPASTMNI